MQQAPVVLAIPESLSRQVLVEWVALRDVARLDSAFCSGRLRRQFHRVAFSDSTIYDAGCKALPKCFFQWCVARSVKIQSLTIRDTLAVDVQLRGLLLAVQGANLQSVDILDSAPHDYRAVLMDLANWCPGIKETCITSSMESTCVLDDSIATFTRASKQLRTLRVDSFNVTSDGLGKALRLCKDLRTLCIKCVAGGVDAVDMAIPSLTELDLSRSDATDVTALAIAENCPRLLSLQIFMGNSVTDAGVRAVLQGCPLLHDTDVECAERISHDLRVELVRRKSPRTFELRSWKGLNDQLVQGIFGVCPALICVDISASSWLTDAALAACGAHCPLLESITITNCRAITDAGVEQLIQPGSKLRSVNFTWCENVLDFVAVVAERCPLLEVLESGLMQVSDTSVVALAEGCPRLRNVSLSRADVGDAGVIALAAHCKQLEELGLGNCMSVTMQGVCILAERCTRLQTLVLPEQLRGEEMPPLASGGEIEWV
jgi:hypothetical protein